MRKVLLAVALCAILSACGKDDSGNNENKPTTPPKKEEPTPPQAQSKEVKDEEIITYFGLDKSLTVQQALEKAKSTSGAKTIGGREINVTGVNEVSRDEKAGAFVVKVAGSAAGDAFEKAVAFTGFAQQPTDEWIARYVKAAWKSGADYQKEFDFDELYRLKNTAKFTAKYLSQFVDFTASDASEARIYTFTQDDLNKIEVKKIEYKPSSSGEGTISFSISYNNILGNTSGGSDRSLSLSFNKDSYYQRQVTVNTAAAKSLYMHGVYENLPVFYASLLQYDEKKFIPQVEHKAKNDSDNSIDVTLKLMDSNKKETEVARFSLTLKGFKPLTELKNDLVLANSSELGTYFGQKFRDSNDGDKLSQVRQYDVKSWIDKAQKSIRRGGNTINLTSTQVKSGNGSTLTTLWKPESGDGSVLDIYLLTPRFEVTEARKEGNFLYLTLKMQSVNEVSLDGVTRPLTVHLWK